MSSINVNTIKSRLGGPPTLPSGVVVSAAATFSSDVSIGGTLTYEDVTNVDVVGIITAKGGIKFGAAGVGGTIRANGDTTLAGVVTATSFYDSSGVALANTAHVSTTGLVVVGVSTLSGNVKIPDSTSLYLGNDDDLELYHAAGGNTYIKNNTGELEIRGNTTKIFNKSTSQTIAGFTQGASVGITTVGILTAYGDAAVGSAITMYASSGIVSATSFHGDGSNLSNVSAGGWIPVANSTVTSGTTLCDFSNCFDGTYDHYRIEFTCHVGAVGNTTVDSLRLQQYDSGSLRTSSDYDYSLNYSGNGTGNRTHAQSSGGNSYCHLSGNQDSQAWQGHIDIWNPDLTVIQAAFNFWMNGYWIKQPDSSENNNRLGVNGVTSACPSDNTPVAVTGFKIYSNASTAFANGNVVVYGLKTS